MSKMGSHDPFGYLKYKLWPKERSGIKLPIWFLTTKSRELPWFSYMQVACHISLESSWQGLQLCFRPHLNQRFTKKVISLQSHWSPNFKNFEIPNLGVPGQNDIWMQAPWPSIENTIRRKVVASPTSGPWWVLWICFCPWFIHAPKVLQLSTNQLVVWLMQICVNNWPAWHSSQSPSQNSSMPFYPRMLRTKRRTPIHYPSIVFIFGFAVESIKEFGGASKDVPKFACSVDGCDASYMAKYNLMWHLWAHHTITMESNKLEHPSIWEQGPKVQDHATMNVQVLNNPLAQFHH